MVDVHEAWQRAARLESPMRVPDWDPASGAVAFEPDAAAEQATRLRTLTHTIQLPRGHAGRSRTRVPA